MQQFLRQVCSGQGMEIVIKAPGNVVEIFQFLEKTGVENNTLFVFISDNGEAVTPPQCRRCPVARIQ